MLRVTAGRISCCEVFCKELLSSMRNSYVCSVIFANRRCLSVTQCWKCASRCGLKSLNYRTRASSPHCFVKPASPSKWLTLQSELLSRTCYTMLVDSFCCMPGNQHLPTMIAGVGSNHYVPCLCPVVVASHSQFKFCPYINLRRAFVFSCIVS